MNAPERTTESYYRQWLREISLARDYESVCLHEDKLLAFMLQRDDLVTELRAAIDRLAPMSCPDCGPNIAIDEDGCCVTCGRDAIDRRAAIGEDDK